MMRKAIILAAFFCAACSNYSANLPSIKPYKMDIQQGNVVTSKMMMQLRPGMTKSQVRFIMGTPLIVDPFHADRWDYLYRMQKGGKLIEQRHVILDFENDKLKGVRGDVIPAGTGEPVPSEGSKPAAKPAAKQKEKSLLDKLKFWKSDEPQAPAKLESQPELTEPKPAAPAKAAPAPVPAPAPKAEPAPQPTPAQQEESAPQAAPAPEPAPAPAQEAAPQPEPAPAPAPAQPEAAPVTPAPKPAPAPEPVKQPEPVQQPAPKAPAPQPEPAKTEPKAATQPAGELPPEDAPDFFERMLEKIGF